VGQCPGDRPLQLACLYGQYSTSGQGLWPSHSSLALLPSGARLSADDLLIESAEMTDAPVDAAIRPEDVIGQTTSQSISARGWIRLNSLKQASVIQARAPVRVQIKGSGFQASGEGIALTDGAVGDTVTVRLSDGGQVSGRVVGPGEVEITVK